MNADGSDAHPIATLPGEATRPAWGPAPTGLPVGGTVDLTVTREAESTESIYAWLIVASTVIATLAVTTYLRRRAT